MKSIRIWAFFLFFQTIVVAFAAEATEISLGKAKGFLFEVKKNQHISYVFGTIHTGLSDVQLLDQNIINLMSLSKKIYVEADISEIEKNSAIIEKYGLFEEKKLPVLLSPEDYDLYKYILVERGNFFSSDEFDRAKPWLVAMVIPIADSLTESYPLLKYGSDIQIIEFAKLNGVPLIELEGIEFQTLLFEGMSDQDAREYFSAYVGLVKKRIVYRRIANEIRFWSSADYVALEKLITEARGLNDFYSRFYFKNIIDARNARLATSIASIMEVEDGGFFSFGCEHLVGSSGVLAQLSKKGFEVKRINGD